MTRPSPLRRLRRNAVLLLMLATASLGGLLLAASFILARDPLGAGTVACVTIWVLLFTWNQHRTGSQVRQLARRPAPAAPTAPAPVVATGSAAAAPELPTPAHELGATVPQASVADHAAAAPEPPPVALPSPSAGHQPDMQLWEMVDPDGTGVAGPARTIGLIGPATLAAAVEPHGRVVHLHPCLCIPALEHAGASTVIIDEDSLTNGGWQGALEAQGTPLLRELRAVIEYITGRQGLVYVVATAGMPSVAAGALREGTVVIDSTRTGTESGITLLDTLVKHRQTVA